MTRGKEGDSEKERKKKEAKDKKRGGEKEERNRKTHGLPSSMVPAKQMRL